MTLRIGGTDRRIDDRILRTFRYRSMNIKGRPRRWIRGKAGTAAVRTGLTIISVTMTSRTHTHLLLRKSFRPMYERHMSRSAT